MQIFGQKGDTMELELAKELLERRTSNYHELFKNDTVEVRKYNPQRRTVSIAGRNYFLQFPYTVFALRKTPDLNFLYLGFAKERDDRVYFPPLGNVQSLDWCVCISLSYFYCVKPEMNLSKVIDMFWTTGFSHPETYYRRAEMSLRENFQTYHVWQRMPLKDVLGMDYDWVPKEEFLETIQMPYTQKELVARHILKYDKAINCDSPRDPKRLHPFLPV
jgi:hypothetical protein